MKTFRFPVGALGQGKILLLSFFIFLALTEGCTYFGNIRDAVLNKFPSKYKTTLYSEILVIRNQLDSLQMHALFKEFAQYNEFLKIDKTKKL